MEASDAQKIIEALFFVAEQPVTLKMLETVFDKEFSKDDLRSLIAALSRDYIDRSTALEVREIAGGWQLASKPELAPWVRKLFKDRLTYRLSPSALETLSIVAYKQPITRGEIEEIRGVEVSAVIDTLVDRKLVRLVGRKETLGRPILFGTTPEFLRIFGLKRLEDLPAVDTLLPPAEPGSWSEENLSDAPVGHLTEPSVTVVGVAQENLPRERSGRDIETLDTKEG